MEIYLELLTTEDEFKKSSLRAIIATLHEGIKLALPSIRRRVRQYTPNILRNSPTYKSLINGDLSAEFGFIKGGGLKRMDAILDAVSRDIHVSYKALSFQGSKIGGGITISVINENLSHLININEAYVYTEKGDPLPWLRWLLLEGDAVIISGFSFKSISGRGRSGSGVMVNHNTGLWRVPPQHAGTLRNNFITKTFMKYQSEIADTYKKIISEEIGKKI